MVNVLIANVDALWQDKEAAANIALQALPHAMQSAIVAYKSEDDRLLRLTGKVLLQQLLTQHGQGYTLSDIQRTNNNRPYIPNSGLNFSIAHSGKLAVCALSTEGSIGIDIELIIPTDWQLLQHFFRPQDWTEVTRAPQPLQVFFRLWTQREACIKAESNDTFSEAPFSFKGWHLHRLDAGNGYAATIATRQKAAFSVEWLHAPHQQTIRNPE